MDSDHLVRLLTHIVMKRHNIRDREVVMMMVLKLSPAIRLRLWRQLSQRFLRGMD